MYGISVLLGELNVGRKSEVSKATCKSVWRSQASWRAGFGAMLSIPAGHPAWGAQICPQFSSASFSSFSCSSAQPWQEQKCCILEEKLPPGLFGVDEKQKWTLIFWHTVPKSCVFQICSVGRSPEEDLDWNPAHDMVVNTKTPWSGCCCCSFNAFFHHFLPMGQETVLFDGRTWPNLSSFCLQTLSLVTRANKRGGHWTRSALWVVLAISTRHLAYCMHP